MNLSSISTVRIARVARRHPEAINLHLLLVLRANERAMQFNLSHVCLESLGCAWAQTRLAK